MRKVERRLRERIKDLEAQQIELEKDLEKFRQHFAERAGRGNIWSPLIALSVCSPVSRSGYSLGGLLGGGYERSNHDDALRNL